MRPRPAAAGPLAGLLASLLLLSGCAASSPPGRPATTATSPADAGPTPLAGAVPRAAIGMHDAAMTSGATYGAVRLWDTGTTWAMLEPQRGRFEWARLDALVGKAQARGAEITLVLGSTPAWAATDPAAVGAPWLTTGAASPPRSVQDWAAYVGAVARRYRGRIRSYEIWNEAALRLFWHGTADQLAALTQVANDRLAAVDPRATIVSTSLLPRQRAWTTWASSYLRGLRVRGWPVDVFALHSYQPDDLATPDGRVTTVRSVQQLLAAAGAPRRPLWDTEANYTSPAFEHRKITGQQSADWLARAYVDSVRLGVARTYWYGGNASTALLAIDTPTPSESQRALSTVGGWLVGATMTGCTASSWGVVSCTLTRGSARSVLTWAPAGRTAPLPVRARTACTLLHGCRPVTAASTVTSSPVLLRGVTTG